MRSLEQINKDNGSDGKPMLDSHPGRTAGLPETGPGVVIDMFLRSKGWCGIWFVTNQPSRPHAYCRRDHYHDGQHSITRFNADEDKSLR